ncbi:MULTISPECIES: hypothetical protein [Cupriavidus]|uniref:hypothetical protein n=1 Tax=Cupriavidus TaxID=106589 RepID=UPI0012469222|nr:MULTISPECIES: hypothetical protein [Cupriavidus]KAB0599739.1 hypothetical protein F7R19_24660 [Cupriavidus pauculus]KAI3591796.1 hypothetical protein D9X30_3206 [Cupriavidus sp. U2]UAL03730.1 hypothetical protein K8O84_28650 [Cupriavidus pauculus]
MRFTRLGRHDPIDFNTRRQAAFARKQQRERDRYPLFADHVAAEQHTPDEELARRQRRSENLARTTRTLHARIWREKRAVYFSLTPAQQAEIRAKWLAWTGPTTALYFAYIVDGTSGEAERRDTACREKALAIRRRVLAMLPEQAALEISAP